MTWRTRERCPPQAARWETWWSPPKTPRDDAAQVPLIEEEALPVPSLVRIDYVLHSSHFATRRAWVPHDETGSDHRPVVADLTLRVS